MTGIGTRMNPPRVGRRSPVAGCPLPAGGGGRQEFSYQLRHIRLGPCDPISGLVEFDGGADAPAALPGSVTRVASASPS
jgi:hypothetical protein